MRNGVLAVAVALAAGCGSTDEPGTERTRPSDDASSEAAVDAGDASPEATAESSSEAAGETGSDVDAAPDAATALTGNALLLSDGGVTPLYDLSDPGASTPAVAFLSDGDTVQSLDSDGALLWEKNLGQGSLFGGFDFDADGWPDLGLVRSQDTGKVCGTGKILLTSIDFVRGKTGELYSGVSGMESLCWTFGTTTYPTEQWTALDVLFGAGTSTLAAIPYYATQGWYLSFGGTGFTQTGSLYYPSTDAWDSTYTADLPNAHGAGHSYEQYSHVPNGLVLPVSGEQRLVVFTTARVAQYRIADVSASQLAADTPFITANRTDLVGRDYGLVLADPSFPSHVILLSGTSADTLFSDMNTSTMEADPWGQIERHLTIYDAEKATVEDRFFSYAHDNNDGNKYEGRLVYPDNPIVRVAGSPSRLAYNVYEGGHWQLHVSQPGVTADAKVIADWFLWDIRDVDQDGDEDWVLSPTEPTNADPGWYFVRWKTALALWNESTLGFEVSATHEGVIPYLLGSFRRPDKTTTRGALYPVLTVATPEGLRLVMLGSDKQMKFVK
jgi:hypothetical protein